MKIDRDHRDAHRNLDTSVDERIRRRFRWCETLPLFTEKSEPHPPGLFQPPHTGAQLRFDLRPRAR